MVDATFIGIITVGVINRCYKGKGGRQDDIQNINQTVWFRHHESE